MPNYEASEIGEIRRIDSCKVLKPCNKNGYLAVSLWMDGLQYPRYVHRLVVEAFNGEINGFEINHIDGNKQNNKLSNLEVVTSTENKKHAYKNNLRFVTTKQKSALLKNVSKQVMDIETGIFYDSLSDACKFTNHNYGAIRNRIHRNSKNIRFIYI